MQRTENCPSALRAPRRPELLPPGLPVWLEGVGAEKPATPGQHSEPPGGHRSGRRVTWARMDVAAGDGF